MIIQGTYKFFYNNLGQLDCVNDAKTGATVYIPNSDRYTPESNPLTAAFLATDPDLSDKPELAVQEDL